jgi:hypothetical protein
MDFAGQWGWHQVDAAALKQIAGRLALFERMTWAELQKPGSHTIATGFNPDRICLDAQRRLEDLQLDDRDQIWELHLGGQPRLWGMRERDAFHFLWWDPLHEVCPPKK